MPTLTKKKQRAKIKEHAILKAASLEYHIPINRLMLEKGVVYIRSSHWPVHRLEERLPAYKRGKTPEKKTQPPCIKKSPIH